MARGFVAALNRAARASERAARANARAHAAQVRAAERHDRLMSKIAKQTHLEGRITQAEDANQQLDETIASLRSILKDGMSRDPKLDFSFFIKRADERSLNDNPNFIVPRVRSEQEFSPEPLSWFSRLWPGAEEKHQDLVAAGKREYLDYQNARNVTIERRRKAFVELEAKTAAANKEFEEWRVSAAAGESEAITSYYRLAFDKAEYPDGFPAEYQFAYTPESKQLIVEVQFPTIADIIPTVERYKYIKSSDQIAETRKSEKSRQALYIDALAQAALRCLHDAFRADPSNNVDVVVVNAYLETVDPSTGQDIKPYVISVRISRDQFAQLALQNIDPISCLKHLQASVSRNPAELVAIKPIVDINMFDPRFVQEQDIISRLDSRPNLMELSPSEFESLITNLFQKMGLDTKLTQASRDGGVDCVAWDPRPVLGGKVIVQAKRYKNTVGVSAVRDLFGTVHNEGASKGILVATSGYGKAAYDFANGKPLELITGSNLLYLLKEHSGVEAKIVMPDDWSDPPANF
jgi:restriction system protein